MHKGFQIVGGLSLMLTTGVAAQEYEPATDGDSTVLERILVTDGLTPVAEARSGRAYTVITGEWLEANQVRYVADALRQVPGFSVSRTGSYGGLTQVRVRGAEANQLLVMVDGIDVSEVAQGEFDFSSLLVDDIDRIEILRGPQSAFWGSKAMAGVVNIITRRGERDGFSVRGKSEAGTDGTWLGGLSLSGGGTNYDVALSGLFRETGGFNISDFGSEDDGDRNATFNGKVTVDLTPNLTVDGTLRYVHRDSDIDAQDYSFGNPTYGQVLDTDDEAKTRELFGSAGATLISLDGALTQKARFTFGDTERENFESGARSSWNEGGRYTGTYQASYEFDTPGFLDATHQFTGGYEWERETFLPSHLTDRLSRNSNSLIGQYRGDFLEQVSVNASVRHDFNDAFDDATTFSLSVAWRVPGTEARLHTSVGTGVTNPTFYEQFGYVPSAFVGNPNLKPEESLGWDIGLEYGFFDRALVVDLTYFNQDLTNEIFTSYAGPLPTPVNMDGVSDRQGVELAATLNLTNGLSATATYTYTDAAEQQVAGGPQLREVRRPEHSGSFNVAYTFLQNRGRVFGEVVFNGDMLDLDFSTYPSTRVTLDGYTVVNVGGSYRFNDSFEAFGRVENLFDEDYEEVLGYNTQGRVAFIGLRGRF
ncbi:TonB-dependent receptor plug domain-containing protein [Mesorhizobium xinjiangense]|uniref:TonB-dependent receptor plug domain-containing protein n=1 Tax=Mesorhizobium xinjiangense TaxID=2678685 RepID=UPI0018DDB620|nr:TonB-dependent receptor [Mesorhizobium xinjiangense]